MRIIIDGKFAIDRSYEAFVIQRYTPEHPATRDYKGVKKGDIVPARWDDDCYPHTIERALEIVLQDAVMLSPETVTDIKDAIAEFKRIERAVLGACEKLGAAINEK